MEGAMHLFLEELDAYLAGLVAEGEVVKLYHIGKSSINLRYGTAMATGDFDILMCSPPAAARCVRCFWHGHASA